MRANDPSTIFEAFSQTVQKHSDRAFLRVLEETAETYAIPAGEIPYRAAAARVDALAQTYKARGYGHGHRVGLLLENRPDYFLHWFALNALGASVVPINPDLRSTELEYLLGHSEVLAVVAIAAHHGALANAAAAIGRKVAIFGPQDEPPEAAIAAPKSGPADRESECALLYTSGTTGLPKGCILPNEYFLHAGRWYATAGGLIAMREGAERMLTPLPVFHMNAMAYSAMAMVTTGGCLIALDRFHPKSWWRSVRDSAATIVHYLGVMPAMLIATPESPADKDHKVRFGFGAGVERSLQDAFEARFGFPLIEAWAMTETGAGAVVVASKEPRHTGTNCFGRPGPDVEIRIVAEDGKEAGVDVQGELLVRHAGLEPHYGFFRAYLKDPEATASAWQGGWFHTGDIVRRSADDSLHFVDRKKNVIRRSGENISAVEVENVLIQHPLVKQVGVAATPDAVRGDEVAACIVTHAPVATHDEREKIASDIVRFCLSRLAYYKAPGYVAFVPEVALTSTQKIQRGALKELVAHVISTDLCIDTRMMKRRAA